MSLDHYLPAGSYPTICDLFKAGADDTWNRIAFSRTTPRLKIHETTITQNLVYEMNLLQTKYPLLGFTLYESRLEKTNGDDLELCVLHDDGNTYTYAIQAKIIYHPSQKKPPFLQKGHYPQMKHYVGKKRKNQVELLINYAKRPTHGYVPLYLLYNCIYKYFRQMGYRKSAYGCTVVSAYYLKRKHGLADGNLSHKVTFANLHPGAATPWESLICDLISTDTAGLATRFELPPDHPLSKRPVTEILSDPDWLLFTTDQETGKTNVPSPAYREEQIDKVMSKEKLNTQGFRPKFRIVIGTSTEFTDQNQIQ